MFRWKRENGVRKATESINSIPGKTAALVPEFAVEDLPSAELQPMFLRLQWRTCPWAEHDDDDDSWFVNTVLSLLCKIKPIPVISSPKSLTPILFHTIFLTSIFIADRIFQKIFNQNADLKNRIMSLLLRDSRYISISSLYTLLLQNFAIN